MLLVMPAVQRDASRPMWKPAPRAMRCVIFVAVNPSCCCAEFESELGSLQNYKTRSDVDDITPSNKRKRSAGPLASSSVSKKQGEDMTQRMADSGLFSDDFEDEADDTGPSELTLRDVCQQEFDRFQDHFTDARSTDYRWGRCFRSGPERGGRSTRTWRAWLEFYCLCRNLLPSSRETSARLGALSPGPVAGWPVGTWR